jgi:pimeloyl-ACP methyl ester carboxylesterase
MGSENLSWRSPELGEARTLELSQGKLRYHERGEGPAIVFVHGIAVNANLWRNVVARLGAGHRCISLDMPLGAHLEPLPDGDVSPPGLAELAADALDALGLEDVTLVGNDTGGAVCQILASRRPERLGRLVLTSCDSYERFPPKQFAFLAPLARLHGLIPVLFAPLRWRPARRLPIALGWVTKRKVQPEAEDSYVYPLLMRKGVRADFGRVVAGIDPSQTLEAAERLRSFDKPVLLAWSAEDKLFPRSDAERLAATFPDARLEWVEDARTFSAEDNPVRVAELIQEFITTQRTSSVPV